MENVLSQAYGHPSVEPSVFFLSDVKSQELKVSLQTKVMAIPNILNAMPHTGKMGLIVRSLSIRFHFEVPLYHPPPPTGENQCIRVPPAVCIANFSWTHNLNPYLHAFRRDHTTNFHGTSQDSRSLPTDKAWSNSPLCSSKPCEHLPNPLMPPPPGPSSINFCYLEEPGIEVRWQLIWANLSETRGQLGCPHQSHLGI